MAMRQEYYKLLPSLPPSRECAADDAAGIWRQKAQLAVNDSINSGNDEKKYLAFGEHNRLLQLSSKEVFDEAKLKAALDKSLTQYILTLGGILYIYERGVLDSLLLCFVSTEEKGDYSPGLLMLAIPVEDGKPLAITLYEPLK